jgi:glycosyltransferase involved in cell wall biosynthesis
VRQLTIGIDGYNLAMPKGTGIATYGINLASTLSKAGHRIEAVFGLHVGNDPKLRETLFFDRVGREQTGRTVFGGRWRRRFGTAWATVNQKLSACALEVPLTSQVDKDGFADNLPRFDRLTSAAGLFALAQRHFSVTGRYLPLRMEKPPEIMHWTYPVPVRLEGARNVYTIHDLVPLRLPYTTLGDKPRFRRLIEACAATADHICTVSEYSRQDLITQFKLDGKFVSNTYQTATLPELVQTEDFSEAAAVVNNTLGLPPKSYFLFFGALEPKKNVGRLIEAFLGLSIKTPLVIVGGRSWMADAELSVLHAYEQAHPGQRRIIRLDYLSRELMLRLIRTARGVLFPSISEGFGLPVLEAMQLGCPVLTSNRSSLPEVAGDAATLVDPYDVSSIAAGIRRLDENESLREQLSAAGPAQAAKFDHAAYLERLETMYSRLL